MKTLKDKKDVLYFHCYLSVFFNEHFDHLLNLNISFDVIEQGKKKHIYIKEDYFLIGRERINKINKQILLAVDVSLWRKVKS